jgi:hypothetical protein
VDKDGFASTKVAGGTDCDDTNAMVKPSGVEKCGDKVDQDCSGSDLACSDLDLDGDSFSPAQGDCNDNDKAVSPAATELPYNGKDDDCAVTTPDDDLDGDGFFKVGGGDCDDSKKAINPSATEIPYDGIDQNCDGKDLTDVDGDGFSALKAGGKDCDDLDPKVNPAAPEIPHDTVDQNCDGSDLVVAGATMLLQIALKAPSFAVAAGSTHHLVVWNDGLGTSLAPHRVMALLVSAKGAPISKLEIRSAAATVDEARVASDGTGFLVAYRFGDGKRAVIGQRVTHDGALLGPAFAIHETASIEGPHDLSIAGLGGSYGLAWIEDDQVLVCVMDMNGPTKPQPASTGKPNQGPRIAPAGKGFLTTWVRKESSGANLIGRWLAGGTFTTGEVSISNASGDQGLLGGGPSAWDGTQSLVVFDDNRNGNLDLYGQLVTDAGKLVGPSTAGFPVATNPANLTAHAVAFCGNRHTALVSDTRHKGIAAIFRQPVGTDGKLQDGTPGQNLVLYASGQPLSGLQTSCLGGLGLAVFYESGPKPGFVAIPFAP